MRIYKIAVLFFICLITNIDVQSQKGFENFKSRQTAGFKKIPLEKLALDTASLNAALDTAFLTDLIDSTSFDVLQDTASFEKISLTAVLSDMKDFQSTHLALNTEVNLTYDEAKKAMEELKTEFYATSTQVFNDLQQQERIITDPNSTSAQIQAAQQAIIKLRGRVNEITTQYQAELKKEKFRYMIVLAEKMRDFSQILLFTTNWQATESEINLLSSFWHNTDIRSGYDKIKSYARIGGAGILMAGLISNNTGDELETNENGQLMVVLGASTSALTYVMDLVENIIGKNDAERIGRAIDDINHSREAYDDQKVLMQIIKKKNEESKGKITTIDRFYRSLAQQAPDIEASIKEIKPVYQDYMQIVNIIPEYLEEMKQLNNNHINTYNIMDESDKEAHKDIIAKLNSIKSKIEVLEGSFQPVYNNILSFDKGVLLLDFN